MHIFGSHCPYTSPLNHVVYFIYDLLHSILVLLCLSSSSKKRINKFPRGSILTAKRVCLHPSFFIHWPQTTKKMRLTKFQGNNNLIISVIWVIDAIPSAYVRAEQKFSGYFGYFTFSSPFKLIIFLCPNPACWMGQRLWDKAMLFPLSNLLTPHPLSPERMLNLRCALRQLLARGTLRKRP